MMKNRLDLLTQKQIDWCETYLYTTEGEKHGWHVNDDGKIESNSKSINLFCGEKGGGCEKIPVKFASCDFFYCFSMKNLKSLKGFPTVVEKDCFIDNLGSLRDLRGISSLVLRDLTIENCQKLASFRGLDLTMICRDFVLKDCPKLESIENLKETKIEHEIKIENCKKLKKYEPILSNINVFRRWQKTDLVADEFLEKYSGFIDGQNYEI